MTDPSTTQSPSSNDCRTISNDRFNHLFDELYGSRGTGKVSTVSEAAEELISTSNKLVSWGQGGIERVLDGFEIIGLTQADIGAESLSSQQELDLVTGEIFKLKVGGDEPERWSKEQREMLERVRANFGKTPASAQVISSAS